MYIKIYYSAKVEIDWAQVVITYEALYCIWIA